MNEAEVLAYVKAAAVAVGIPLDDARAQRVAGHLGRTAGMAQLLDNVSMPEDLEPAEVYKAAAFPVGAA